MLHKFIHFCRLWFFSVFNPNNYFFSTYWFHVDWVLILLYCLENQIWHSVIFICIRNIWVPSEAINLEKCHYKTAPRMTISTLFFLFSLFNCFSNNPKCSNLQSTMQEWWCDPNKCTYPSKCTYLVYTK